MVEPRRDTLPVNGTPLDGDLTAEAGGGMSERNCFSAGTTHSVVFAWWVPVDHDDGIEGDPASFDLSLQAEQCRHNGGEGMGRLTSETRYGSGIDEGGAEIPTLDPRRRRTRSVVTPRAGYRGR